MNSYVLSFSVWLTSQFLGISSLFHMALFQSLCFFKTEWYSIVIIYHIFFIHSSIGGHLGCFHVLAVVNSGCCEHWGACIFLNYGFLWMDVQEWDCWILSFLKWMMLLTMLLKSFPGQRQTHGGQKGAQWGCRVTEAENLSGTEGSSQGLSCLFVPQQQLEFMKRVPLFLCLPLSGSICISQPLYQLPDILLSPIHTQQLRFCLSGHLGATWKVFKMLPSGQLPSPWPHRYGHWGCKSRALSSDRSHDTITVACQI